VLTGRGSERRVAELATVRELAPNGDCVLDPADPETSSSGEPS
jgi:type IV secretion system protein VirB11